MFGSSSASTADAEVILLQAVDEYARAAPDTWQRYDCQRMLGASLAGQKRYAEAEPMLLSQLRRHERLRATMPFHNRVNRVRSAESLVELYKSWGKSKEAVEWLAKVNQ